MKTKSPWISFITGVGAAWLWLVASMALADPSARIGQNEYWLLRDKLDQAHADRLVKLAERCEQLDLAPQQATTRDWFQLPDPRRQTLYFPAEADPAQPLDDAPQVVHQWYAKFREERAIQADALFQLALRELDADRPQRAFPLFHEVLREDPDHVQSRQVLGYRRVNDRWRKPEGVIRTRQIRLSHPEYRFQGRGYLRVESGNFVILTDHTEEAAVRLIEQLEQLHSVWHQLFFRFWGNAATLRRRLEVQAAPSRSTEHHKIVLFRDRQQYLDHLRPREPRVELTVGSYWASERTAYFYAAEESTTHVCFHEVTHQLFSETARALPEPALKSNFWIIEGVAMYMESLRLHEHYATVGGVDAERLQFARYRARNEGFYVPLADLVALGRDQLQGHEDIRRLYSQSAGLAAMMMDAERGRYRDALADYLQEVYQGRDTAERMAQLCEAGFAELDQQYLRFLDVTDRDLQYCSREPLAENLSLGRTSVSDAGMTYLSKFRSLAWLDLAYTGVGDEGFAVLPDLPELNHLIVEHSRIGDAALRKIATFKGLEILDLTGTHVTDAGLAHLSELDSLRELWLAGTSISDAGLEHLSGLRRLEKLDVSGTGVTAEGWGKLKQRLPALQD